MNEYVIVQKNTEKAVRLYVKKLGQGKPIILVHGAVIDSCCFDKIVDYLSKYYMVITYDRRNYSLSFTNRYVDLETQADDILGIIKYYHLEKVVIIGYSLGGSIVYTFAKKYSNYIKTIILFEPPIIYKNTDIYDEIDLCIRNKKYNKAIYLFNESLGPVDNRESIVSDRQLLQLIKNREVFLENEFNEIKKIRNLFSPNFSMYLGVGEMSKETFLYQNTRKISKILNVPLIFFPGNHNGITYLPFEFFSIIHGIIFTL